MTQTLAKEISTRLEALHNCNRSDNTEWQRKHNDALDELDKQLPSGSGLDVPPKVDRLLIRFADRAFYIHGSYHHMNGDGVYDGWIKFVLRVRATFRSVDVDVHQHEETANWDDDLADYLCETFQHTLSEPLESSTPNPVLDPLVSLPNQQHRTALAYAS